MPENVDDAAAPGVETTGGQPYDLLLVQPVLNLNLNAAGQRLRALNSLMSDHGQSLPLYLVLVNFYTIAF